MLWTFEGNYIFKRCILPIYCFYVYCFIHFTDRILLKNVLKLLPVSTFSLTSCLLIILTLKGKRTKDKTAQVIPDVYFEI